MARVEDTHWWYLGMASLVIKLLDRFDPAVDEATVLDAGCGTGGALATYLNSPVASGCDISRVGLSLCQRRGLSRLAQASITQLPFADGSFAIVTSLDVLYERGVQDDEAAVTEMARVLRPGGVLAIRVPAHEWLRGQHDQVTHTRHRYSPHGLRRLIGSAHLDLAHLTFANATLFPAIAVKRLLERLWPAHGPSMTSDLEWEAGLLNAPLRWLLELEARVAAGCGLPLGLSLVAVGRKLERP